MSNPYQSPESSPFDPPPRAFDAPPPTPAIVCAWLSIVYGAFNLLCSPVGLASLFIPQPPLPNGQPNPMAEVVTNPTYQAGMVASVVLTMIGAGILIAGGIGLLRKRAWGRTLTVTYGIYAIAMTFASILFTYWFVAQPLLEKAQAVADPGEKGGLIGGAIGGVVGGVCGGLFFPIVVLILMNLKSVTTYYRSRTKAASADPFLS